MCKELVIAHQEYRLLEGELLYSAFNDAGAESDYTSLPSMSMRLTHQVYKKPTISMAPQKLN